ncbi:MAG: LPXTG cell wall anchor domain-containing protein, partial [Ilumatobacter fluminis]
TGSLTECEIIALPAGEYTLGEVLPSHGYEVGSVECDSYISLGKYFGETDRGPLEMIDDEGAAFATDDGDAYCTVTNVYREGQLIVTASVNNDDGGVAGVEDVSIEVYEADGDTPVIAATACAADGSCLDEMLPIGDYVIGYIGPDGYTREITQSVSLVVTEKVTDDADAAFTAAFGEVVEIEVAIDDPAPEPTTTTTEPATTTTVFDAGAGTLPPTGASSETNTTIAVLAFALIAAGLALVGVRRRTA